MFWNGWRNALQQARRYNMTTLNVLLLTLNFNVLILETRGIYENLNRRKDKGRNALTSQPFSQFSPITEQIDHDKL